MKTRKIKSTTILAATLFSAALIWFAPVAAQAQGSAFSFQGRLNDGTNPANGSYDLQFRLYDAIAGGAQIGSLVARPNTTLINGVFSVTLDFGATAFNNPNSVFIEIAVKPNGSPNAYTILGPRQQLTAVPTSVRAENSAQLGGVAANEYVLKTDTQVFIRNQNPLVPQAGASFNISGTGIFGGNVGIGTSIPTSRLEIVGQDAITVRGFQPVITLTDSNAANQRGLIQGANGNIFFYPHSFIGGASPLVIKTGSGTTEMRVLQITGGSDLAENFELAETATPGMVVAIDPANAGKLIVSRGAYNRRVAGIISGANDLAAGMLLPDLKETGNSSPVALSGRVWVYADADENSILPGDLLTTSDTPGHAMKVTNHKKAQGAIIGKAMTGLKSGKGLVLVLVSLQ